MDVSINKKNISLYFFGDSICVGQFVSVHETWTVEISREIASQVSNLVTTQISAINGETSRDALNRLSHSITNHHPDIVWVQFGLNDANFWESDHGLARTSPQSFAANLAEIIDKILVCGSRRVLVATNHRVTKIPLYLLNNQYINNAKLYNQIIRNIVATYVDDARVSLVDIELLFEKYDLDAREILLDDGVHLNRLGHQLYFEQVFPIIKSSVLELFG
jgi:lysophospholipase L1-like esterase